MVGCSLGLPPAERESGVFAASWLALRTTRRNDPHIGDLFDRDRSRLGLLYREDVPPSRSSGQRVVDWTLEWVLPKRAYDTVRFTLVSADEIPLLAVVFPGEHRERRAVISDASGNEVGEVVKRTGWGKKTRFDLVAADQRAAIHGEDWLGFHFRIEVGGTSVGRITNSHLASRAATQYLLELDDHLEGPLRSVVLGALVGMEVTLAQRQHHIP